MVSVPSGNAIRWPEILGPILGNGITEAELTQLNQAIGGHSRRCVRLHPNHKPLSLPFECTPVPWYPLGFWLTDNDVRPGAFLHYASGDYYIQDAGSMLALALADIQPGQWVCDTCASPGGKSTGLLEALAGTGLVLSNEVIRSRLEILELSLARSGFSNYLMANREVDELAGECGDQFDCVIVDAPCTGQSMLAKGKQSLSAFTRRQIEHSALRQKRILAAAAQMVKPGGRLIYSTCTFSYEENEAVIAWLMQTSSGWKPIEMRNLSAWSSGDFPGCYRLWPHRDGCAGGFAAGLIRTHSQPVPIDAIPSADNRLGKRSNGKVRTPFTRRIERSDFNWLTLQDASALELYQIGHQIHFFHPAIPREWIPIADAGVAIASARGPDDRSIQDWIPAYPSAVAMPGGLAATSSVELDDSMATAYLAGAGIHLPTPNAQSDTNWRVAKWHGRPLAWSKQVGGTLKNHLPKSLRKPGLTGIAIRRSSDALQ